MSEYAERFDEFERDGWSVTVDLEPDWDYEPGRSDDIYVSMDTVQDLSRGYGKPNDAQTCPRCEGAGVEEVPDGFPANALPDYEEVECPICEGAGEVPDPDGFEFDTRNGPLYVPGAEVRRLIAIGVGEDPTPADRKRLRDWIESTTQAIGAENLTWYGVVVTASLNGLEGSASIWGVDYDNRDNEHRRQSDDYVREVADDLVPEAISEAARAVLGGLAPLALGY